MLDVPERHPNRADLEAGAYYRNDPLHELIHGLLDTQRRCLVVGRPGHGKTALAKAIGWELLSREARHAVFYVSASTDRSCERWLYHIKAFDHDWVTFILDDCHHAPEQVRALLDAWPDVCRARLLLVSRPLDASVVGPAEEDFQDALEAIQVRVREPYEGMIRRILERILKRDQLVGRDPGPLDRVVSRCRGDLHILEFLVRAWLEQPADVPLGEVGEDRILEAVYSRYLGGARREAFRQHIAAIAALSQFEIPVESRWLRDESAVATLKADAYVEVVIEHVGGVPREFLRYFHSTPARYVVQATYRQGILAAPSVDAYVFDRLVGYIRSLPGNLLEVFPQLHRNERDDLQVRLFADESTMEAVARFLRSVRVPPSAEWLGDFARLTYGVWRWEGDAGPVARRLVQEFMDRVGKVERRALLGSLDLGWVVMWLWAMRKVDPDLTGELIGALDYTELGRALPRRGPRNRHEVSPARPPGRRERGEPQRLLQRA